MRRSIAMVGMVAVVGAGVSTVPVSLAGAATCPAGTWTLSNASAWRMINTRYGRLTVSPLAGGSVTLAIGAAGTWQLVANKSFHATGTGPLGTASGTVALSATAGGTSRTKANGALVFRIAAASGTAGFAGTVNGAPLSYHYTLVKSDVQQYFGIKGKAVPTCSAGPHLKLRFNTATLSF